MLSINVRIHLFADKRIMRITIARNWRPNRNYIPIGDTIFLIVWIFLDKYVVRKNHGRIVERCGWSSNRVASRESLRFVRLAKYLPLGKIRRAVLTNVGTSTRILQMKKITYLDASLDDRSSRVSLDTMTAFEALVGRMNNADRPGIEARILERTPNRRNATPG